MILKEKEEILLYFSIKLTDDDIEGTQMQMPIYKNNKRNTNY